MLQLPRAPVTIDLASGVDCNICNHFFADEFRPLDVDIFKKICMRNKVICLFIGALGRDDYAVTLRP